MNKIAKVFGRLLAVLINNGVIEADEAIFILEPLNEKEGEENESD